MRNTESQFLIVRDDGTYELLERFRASAELNPEIKTFPFGDLDLHLSLYISNHEIDEFVLESSRFELNKHKEEDLVRGNWTFSGEQTEGGLVYEFTNHSEERFSKSEFHFTLHHDFYDGVFKVILPAFSIIFLSLLINNFASLSFPTNADWRIGGQLTLMLTVIALKFSLAGELPKTHYLHLSDALLLVAAIVTTLNLAVGVLLNNAFQKGEMEVVRAKEKQLEIILMLITLALVGWVFFHSFS